LFVVFTNHIKLQYDKVSYGCLIMYCLAKQPPIVQYCCHIRLFLIF